MARRAARPRLCHQRRKREIACNARRKSAPVRRRSSGWRGRREWPRLRRQRRWQRGRPKPSRGRSRRRSGQRRRLRWPERRTTPRAPQRPWRLQTRPRSNRTTRMSPTSLQGRNRGRGRLRRWRCRSLCGWGESATCSGSSRARTLCSPLAWRHRRCTSTRAAACCTRWPGSSTASASGASGRREARFAPSARAAASRVATRPIITAGGSLQRPWAATRRRLVSESSGSHMPEGLSRVFGVKVAPSTIMLLRYA
mmetsp:Transcript_37406/g.123901  ORF Transcript_37406/g.123901 Transcript_37406/m.123901 type:complete len:254 (+) Transcript_37406:1283-2044(+)